MDNVTLRINGTDYSGWTSVRINRSIEQVCGTFNLTLSERWGDSSAPPQIRAGDACEVYCGDDRVLTGYVDDALPAYDAETHSISIAGRSKAGDLVDCGLPARQFTEPRTLLQLARAVAGSFDIDVRAQTDVGAPFKHRPQIEVGQTGFEFLEKLARQRGVRFMSDADGTLLIVRAGKTVAPASLVLGENIKAASGQFTQRDRYNQVVVVGQTAGTDTWNGEQAAVNQGKAQDKTVRANRQHYIVAENAADSADCKRRAQWQRNTAYGRGQALTYTVVGWRHNDWLWQPNVLVPVTDEWLRMDNERLLIASVQYSLDEENGQQTELQLMPPEAFDLVPTPEPDAEASEKWN
ncbi:phage baseplate assembly protein [Thiohalophilus sp.]|uniref:phage baseplate assembly protein n=1 Tax=Thiohalophilus sp. TaxID=3028392 RepID=UPI002ACD204F|nr:hypothetical protein [Thiohalophilus sp.]MDZ7804343.1 hypothetical protein [Thiohalophilus sp.]